MNRHQIMYLLLERGYTQSRIAREIGVTPQAVSSIVRGTATSERIKKPKQGAFEITTKISIAFFEGCDNGKEKPKNCRER